MDAENTVKPEEVSKLPKLTSMCLETNKSAPDMEFEIEHVYGYRAEDCTNNLKYTDKGEVAFMTASVGIVMDTNTGTQKIYGGK
jgi:hypothetical protein